MAGANRARVWANLDNAEYRAVLERAAAEGVSPSDLARLALRARLATPLPTGTVEDLATQVGSALLQSLPRSIAPKEVADLLAVRLGDAVAVVERAAGLLAEALPTLAAVQTDAAEIRAAQGDIARAVGVLAGDVAVRYRAIAADQPVEAVFGPINHREV